MSRHFLMIAVLPLMLISCTIAHDPSTFKADMEAMYTIPRICKTQYNIADLKIAVAPFVNNTTFSNAEISEQSSRDTEKSLSKNTDTESSGETEVTTSKRSKKRSYSKKKSKAKTYTESTSSATDISRKINDNLAVSLEESLTNEIKKIGGIRVYSRTDLPKVLDERKLQNSGLTDEKEIARLGKMAGARYIITGSVNNATLSYQRCQKKPPKKTDNAIIDAAAMAAHLGCKAIEGWNVTTSAAIRMIDVETAEIVFSQVVEGKDRFGQVNVANPSYDSIIGAIKRAGGKAVKDVKPSLSKIASVKGYIKETRTSPDGKERSALLNIGSKKGIAPTSKFAVYYFEESRDPINDTVSCSIIKLPVYLEITDQVQSDHSWAMIKGKSEAIKRVKVGQLIEASDKASGQNVFDWIGL